MKTLIKSPWKVMEDSLKNIGITSYFNAENYLHFETSMLPSDYKEVGDAHRFVFNVITPLIAKNFPDAELEDLSYKNEIIRCVVKLYD